MHRLNQTFLVVVLTLGLVGGVAVADYSRTLGNLEKAGLVESQVETTLLSGEVSDERFVVEVQIENPTRFDLDLNGAYMAATDGNDRLAYGTIVNHDDIVSEIPAQESVTVRYEFALSQQQAEDMRVALDNGTVDVTGQHAVRLADTNFAIEFQGEVGNR